MAILRVVEDIVSREERRLGEEFDAFKASYSLQRQEDQEHTRKSISMLREEILMIQHSLKQAKETLEGTEKAMKERICHFEDELTETRTISFRLNPDKIELKLSEIDTLLKDVQSSKLKFKEIEKNQNRIDMHINMLSIENKFDLQKIDELHKNDDQKSVIEAELMKLKVSVQAIDSSVKRYDHQISELRILVKENEANLS